MKWMSALRGNARLNESNNNKIINNGLPFDKRNVLVGYFILCCIFTLNGHPDKGGIS
jgi:hypothetical protein